MKVYVIVGLYGGVLQDIEAFDSERKSEKFAVELEEKYGIPLTEKEREEYFENPEANEVHRFELEVQQDEDKTLPEELPRQVKDLAEALDWICEKCEQESPQEENECEKCPIHQIRALIDATTH